MNHIIRQILQTHRLVTLTSKSLIICDINNAFKQALIFFFNLQKSVAINPDVIRRTNVYEKYVEDLISQGISKLTIEINKLLISQSVNYDNVLFSPLSIASQFLDFYFFNLNNS